MRLTGALLFLLPALAAERVELRLSRPAAQPDRVLVQEILRTVCPGGVIEDQNRRGFFGCAVCPMFTAFAKEKYGWPAVAMYRGHFTDQKKDQIAVATWGCEPHSLRFGGAALFEKQGERWKFVGYKHSMVIDDCVPVVSRDGRNTLLCQSEDGGQGHLWRNVYLVDLTEIFRPGDFEERPLLHLYDNVNTCGFDENMRPSEAVQRAIFKRIQLDEGVLRVFVEFGQRPKLSASEAGVCLAMLQGKKMPLTFLPKTAPYEIRYRFNGERFSVVPEDVPAKQRVEAAF